MSRLSLLLILLFISGCISFSKLDRGRLLPSDQKSSSLSFTLENNLIMLDVTINGTPGRFLFDNGFSMSALDKTFAEKVGIQPERETSIRDGNNKQMSLQEVTVDMIQIGEFSFSNTGAYILDTKAFMPCNQVDGIIGASVINKINWEIDMQGQTITLSPDPFEGQGFQLDYTISQNNSSMLELEVAGQALKTKIDFGKTASLDVETALVREALAGTLAESSVGISSLSATGLGNIDTTYEFLEPQQLRHQQMDLPLPSEMEVSNNLKYDAYLGLGYFKQYQVIINSSTSHYWLSDPSQNQTKNNGGYGVVFYLVDSQFVIIQKNPYTSGIEAISLLDTVVEIDGEPARRFEDICSWKKYITAKIDQQDSLTFVRSAQPEKTIKLPWQAPALIPFQ